MHSPRKTARQVSTSSERQSYVISGDATKHKHDNANPLYAKDPLIIFIMNDRGSYNIL